MLVKKMAPLHPGEVLLEEFLRPLEISQNQLARDLGVAVRRIDEIVKRKRVVTADTALRLARYFGTSADFWMNLQADYELDVARDEKEAEILETVKPREQRTDGVGVW